MANKIKFTFNKKERLTSKKLIKKLFEEGKHFKNFPFFVRFLVVENLPSRCQILISVPKKKLKKSVDRNRAKRIIREAYRLNKHKLLKCLEINNSFIILSITLYKNTKINYIEANKKINKIIDELCKKISSSLSEKI